MKIALIAHDKKKEEIIELAKKYKDVLANYELYATGTTGTLIMGETALPISLERRAGEDFEELYTYYSSKYALA